MSSPDAEPLSERLLVGLLLAILLAILLGFVGLVLVAFWALGKLIIGVTWWALITLGVA